MQIYWFLRGLSLGFGLKHNDKDYVEEVKPVKNPKFKYGKVEDVCIGKWC